MKTEMELRQEVVQEAFTWLRTPWKHEARCKGAGVDCANFLIGVFGNVNLIPNIKLARYPMDWHLHRDDETYLDWILQFAQPVEPPYLPGDIVAFKYGRPTVSHAGIVVDWPKIVHAYRGAGSVLVDDVSYAPLADRFVGGFRLTAWEQKDWNTPPIIEDTEEPV